jgi:hypothetical protein
MEYVFGNFLQSIEQWTLSLSKEQKAAYAVSQPAAVRRSTS